MGKLYLTPADCVIRAFGGVRKTARALGRDPGCISKWNWPRERKGCGGDIPTPILKKILDIAKEQKLDLTAEHLIYGRTIEAKVEEMAQTAS